MNRKFSQTQTRFFLHQLTKAICLLIGMLTLWNCAAIAAQGQEVGVNLDVKIMCGESRASWAKSTVKVWLDDKPWPSDSLMYASPGTHNLRVVAQEKHWVVKEVKLVDAFKPGSLAEKTTRTTPNTAGEANVSLTFATPTGGTGYNRLEITVETCGGGSAVRISTLYVCMGVETHAKDVTVKIGDQTVTTNALGHAPAIRLPHGTYAVTRIHKIEEEVFEPGYSPPWFIKQRTNLSLLVPDEGKAMMPDPPISVKLDQSEEVLEVKALYCKSRAIAELYETSNRNAVVIRAGKPDSWENIYPRAELRFGDELRRLGSGKLIWIDGTWVNYEAGSPVRIQIDRSRPAGTVAVSKWEFVLRLMEGFIKLLAPERPRRDPLEVEPGFRWGIQGKVEASTTTNYLRGTIATIGTDPQAQQDTISVEEGEVEVRPKNPTLQPVILRPGQQVQVAQNNVGPITPITDRSNTVTAGGQSGISTGATGGGTSSSGIGGVWATPTGETVELTQLGDRVTGTYRGTLGTGSVSGSFNGRTLSGTVQINQGLISVAMPLSLTLTSAGRLEGQVGSALLSVNLIMTRR